MHDSPLSLNDLCEHADVSVRTVRYYIQQGLLPPPDRAGPGATYTPGHLDRLRLIRRLKDQHLPLAKIRRRLAGLSDDDIRTMLDGPTMPHTRSAADYVKAVLGKPALPPLEQARARTAMPCLSPRTTTVRSMWERHTITEDIELHVRRPLSRDQDRRMRDLLKHAHQLFFEESP
jgi:DNA-binding transcriptional MerR regulator